MPLDGRLNECRAAGAGPPRPTVRHADGLGVRAGPRVSGWHHPVGLGINGEANCVYVLPTFEPRLRDPVPPVHELPVGPKDDRMGEVSLLYATCVLGNLSAARSSSTEPAVLIELSDRGYRRQLCREPCRGSPQCLRPPERTAFGSQA